MDFGLVGIESFVGLDSEQQEASGAAAAVAAAEEEKKSNNNGSRSLKQQERSGPIEENCRALKMSRVDDFGISSKPMHIHQGTPLSRSNYLVSDTEGDGGGGGGICGGGGGRSQPQMLSFASPAAVSDVSFLSKEGGGRGCGELVVGDNRNAHNLNLSYYQPTTNNGGGGNSAYNTRSAAGGGGGGYGCGSLSGSMHGSFTGIRGPFTPAQWIELEHQALIYKYLTAGVPVPASLLVPIRKAINPTGFSGFNAGSFSSHPYGWGSFHLGFSGSSDPEPGRCRRTDGKKWRCSKDAVPDQKYCEKHINRGRHRSRKPVEVQTSQAAAATAPPLGVPNISAPTNNNNGKVAPPVPQPSSIVGMSPSLSSNTGGLITIAAQQQPAGVNILTPVDQIVGRFQDSQQGLSMMQPSINLKSKDLPFSVLKQQHIPFGESSSDFGFVSTDSLLNPSQKSSSSSYANAKNFTNSFLDFAEDQQTEDQHSLRRFMDDWPKDHSNRSAMVWPEELKSDWTQLSMSIPMSDFSSSSSSPNLDKIVPSPVKLTREVLEPTQMGLGVGSMHSEPNPKPGDWTPAVSWGGNSMGGPLGEALNNVSNSSGVAANGKSGPTSALNLIGGGGGDNKGWDGSLQLGSSPTGVLQKAAFVSLSNSSSGGSPRAENKKTQEEASLRDDLIRSSHASSSSIPAS